MSASLVILAAGMGSRFKGGVKQLTPVGADGELLMEYSVHDAVRAGFDKVIFVIRKDIEEQFRELIGNKISAHVRVEYCFQEMDALPDGFAAPKERTKPWGTVHALLAAQDCINEPFVIINADDYYGTEAYKKIYDYLTKPDRKAYEQCMGGFVLKNTLSSTGTVTRGVCTAGEKNLLTSVTETYKVSRCDDGIVRGYRDNVLTELSEDSIVSMNMWGCDCAVIPMLRECFTDFLSDACKNGTMETAELALPTAFDTLITSGRASVALLPTNDRWYGMTYCEDVPEIIEAFAEMTRKGIYSSPLFAE